MIKNHQADSYFRLLLEEKVVSLRTDEVCRRQYAHYCNIKLLLSSQASSDELPIS